MLFIDNDFQLRLGLAVVHFLWIACVPAALFALGPRLTGVHSVDARYRWSILTLGSLLPLFFVAFWFAGTRQATPNAPVTAVADLAVNSPPIVVSMTNEPAGASSESPNDFSATGLTSNMPDQTRVLTVAETTESESPVADSWATYVTMAYLVGVAGFTLRLSRGYWLSRRLRRRGRLVTEPDIQRLVDRIAVQTLLRKPWLASFGPRCCCPSPWPTGFQLSRSNTSYATSSLTFAVTMH